MCPVTQIIPGLADSKTRRQTTRLEQTSQSLAAQPRRYNAPIKVGDGEEDENRNIVFAIINKIVTNEDVSTMTDERDTLIELKAIRISHWTFIFGFLLSMGSQALGMQPYVMFILLISSGFVSSIASSIATISFYRKGC